MTKKIDNKVFISDFPFFSKEKLSLLKNIQEHLLEEKKLLVVYTPNAEQMVQTKQDPKFGTVLSRADILLADGKGLVWANNWLNFLGKTRKIKQRIAGVDLVKDLLSFSKKKRLSAILIGGRGYEPNKLPDNLDWIEGYQKIAQPTKAEESDLKQHLVKQKPRIVFVAFGAPFQEKWIDQHRSWFEEAGVKLVMAVGGSFDVITGKLKRAPAWMQALGLEWLFRLIQQPWRWKRQLRLFKFIWLVIRASF
ncbi:MAG: WecB/TagA/CpsF family glycosyltransferase [Patescibacteria group bacterium]|nr:WecB/TagA/CpsF family glycosyltransferase [Patescibacteria group bacterium]